MLLLFTFSLFAKSETEQYIVMFKPNKNAQITTQEAFERNLIRTQSYFSAKDKILETFSNGYVAVMDDKTSQDVQNDPEVAVVERDSYFQIVNFKVADVSKYLDPKLPKPKLVLQEDAPWGISRISGKKGPFSLSFVYPNYAGKNVSVYVIDTGIEVDHPEFKNRARWGANFVPESLDTDEHGHGTHCAGIIGGKRFGVAKNAELVAVKVLDRNGGGLVSRIILGIDYVIKEHGKKLDEYYNTQMDNERKKLLAEHEKMYKGELYDENTTAQRLRGLSLYNNRRDDINAPKNSSLVEYLEKYDSIVLGQDGDASAPNSEKTGNDLLKSMNEFLEKIQYPKSVVNMSVGGLKSMALNYAVEYASSIGIHFSTAAGNDHMDACEFSPGSVKNSITSGASTRKDMTAEFSNFGKCVDLFAPGVEILSSWINTSARVASGTSMAAPHVSGVMAMYLSLHNYTPKELKEIIMKDAVNVVKDEHSDYTGWSEIWPLSIFFGGRYKNLPLVSISRLLRRLIVQ